MRRMRRILAVMLAVATVASGMPAAQVHAEKARTEQKAGTDITGLTVNYQTNPLGIEAEGIRFAWQMDSTAVGAKQTAYQIKVFAEEGNEVWNSGKVESDKSTGIACGGTILERNRYRWELTVWDQAQAAHEAEGEFETGVSNMQEWKDAEFICMNESRFAPIFRTEKALEKTDVKKARLYITALGAYQAYVNGNRVGELDADGTVVYHHMNPGYGNRDVSLGYQTYDVTGFLAGAQSVAVAVDAGTGWYNGMNNTGKSRPAVKALLAVDYADGSSQMVQTNMSDWKGTLAGGITQSGIYYGEDYNAVFAKELGDYTQAGYDDSGWAAGETDEQYSKPRIVNQFAMQTASYVRLSVQESGPADNNGENLLQIMELELLDAEKNNIVRDNVPDISNTWSPAGDVWLPKNLTDGDPGQDSGKGYTSVVLGRDAADSYNFENEPITFTFDLGGEKSFDTLRLYPRTDAAAKSGNECANYPKKYTLQVSQDGENWVDIDLNGDAEGTAYTVDYLRNTVLFPEVETEAAHYDTEFGGSVTAKKVKISVSQVGPAVYEPKDVDKENRLQIMELELWNGSENIAAGKVPTVSTDKPFEFGDIWRAQNLTDGDYGTESDKGYTTDILGRMGTTFDLGQPLTIEFDFDEAVRFSSLRIFPRSTKDSIIGGIYPNYPKKYTVSVSEDGENWTDIATEDKGMVRKQEELRDMKLSTRRYPGVVRAQTGLPGRMSGKYDQSPVSACIYSGNKEGSTYPGGEVNVIAEYSGADLFQDGIELKKGQTMVVNMGQNLTAVPDVRFSAPMGTIATMRFAEMLNDGSESGNGATQADGPKGSIYQKSLRGARSQAKYVFAGDGVEEYQPRMSFFGYQYVELTATEDMVVHGLTSKGISTVSEQTGQIVTNNQDVNKLFNNVLFGQMSNYYTAPTDCNQRDERLSWTGDTQAFAQTAVYNFDSYAFLQDMQEIFDENTQKNGYVAAVTDCVDTNEFFGNWAAGWSDVLIIVPWVLYRQTGDDAFLADNWQYLEKYMTFLKEHERAANQCWIPDNARNFGDWLSFQGTSIEVIYDYYYGYMNQIMAEIAGILGKETEKAAYEQKFQGIKEKFLESHVTFEDGNLVIKSGEGQAKYQFMYDAGKGGKWENNSQTSLLWMLKLGFYSNEEMKAAAEKLLIENIRNIDPPADSIRAEAEKNTLAVGFLGSNVITPVLSDIGNAEVSYDLLLQEGLPSWLFEVKAGATTVWERWNSYTPGKGFGDSEMNSFNHYAYGSVVEWMYRYMAGISSDVENPGFKHIILQPTLDTGVQYNNEERINRVDASYESLYGRIESSWKSADGEMTSYHARVPANTTATLYLPVENVIEENLPQMAGLSFVKMTEHNGRKAAEFTLESGTYDISVRDFTLSGNDDIKTVMISDIVTRKGIEPEFPETALAEYESGKTRVLRIDGWEGLTGNIYGTAGEKNIQASVGGKKWQVKLIVKDKKDCLLADYSFDAGEDGLTDALTAQEDGAEQRKAVKDGAGKDQIKLVEGLKGNALELPGGSSDQKNTGAVILPDDLLKKSDGKWADDFTVSMFLKCADNGFSFAMSLLGKDSDNYIGFVNRTGNGNLISLGAKMSGKVSGEAKKDDGCVKDEWQHFALVVNGSKGKLEIYKNGSLLAEGALEFKPSALAAGMASGHNMLGRGEYSDPDYKGIYDEFQIYDGNLTQPEIKEICDDVLHTTPPDDDNKDKEKAAIESLLEEMNAKGGVTVDEDKNVSLRLSPKTTEDGEFVLPDTCHEDLGVTWEVDEESVIDIKTKPGFAKVEIPDVGEEEKKAKLTASIKLKADGAETETTVKVVFNCMAGTTRDEVLTEALQAQIEAVENYNQQDYTEKTWSVFAAALETARTALAEHSSTESVNLAEKELKDAAAKLERRKGEEEPTEEDVKALDSALKAAYAEKAELEQSKNDYTPESWAEYEAALEAVQEVYDRASKKPAEATAAEVQAARDKLADAKSKLILKAGQEPEPSHPTKIRISGNRSLKIAAKRKVTLKASITPDKARKMGVAWSIAPKDKKYASVSKKEGHIESLHNAGQGA